MHVHVRRCVKAWGNSVWAARVMGEGKCVQERGAAAGGGGNVTSFAPPTEGERVVALTWQRMVAKHYHRLISLLATSPTILRGDGLRGRVRIGQAGEDAADGVAWFAGSAPPPQYVEISLEVV